MRSKVPSLLADTRAATFVEFALISPVLLIASMGGIDAAFNAYTSVVLRGAVADAARDGSLEAASGSTLDAAVATTVRRVIPSANFAYSRKTYQSFSVVGKPEDYKDLNNDGSCNNGEPYEDANANAVWDADRAGSGTGGARDVVQYRVTMTYTRLFPAPGLIGLPTNFSTSATTLLRNQPYRDNRAAPETRNCA